MSESRSRAAPHRDPVLTRAAAAPPRPDGVWLARCFAASVAGAVLVGPVLVGPVPVGPVPVAVTVGAMVGAGGSVGAAVAPVASGVAGALVVPGPGLTEQVQAALTVGSGVAVAPETSGVTVAVAEVPVPPVPAARPVSGVAVPVPEAPVSGVATVPLPESAGPGTGGVSGEVVPEFVGVAPGAVVAGCGLARLPDAGGWHTPGDVGPGGTAAAPLAGPEDPV